MSYNQDQDHEKQLPSEMGIGSVMAPSKNDGLASEDTMDATKNQNGCDSSATTTTTLTEQKTLKRDQPCEDGSSSHKDTILAETKRSKPSHSNGESLIGKNDILNDNDESLHRNTSSSSTFGDASTSVQQQSLMSSHQWTHESSTSAFSPVEVRNPNDNGALSALSSPCSSPINRNASDDNGISSYSIEHGNSFETTRSDSVGEGEGSSTSSGSSSSRSHSVPAAPPPTPISGVFRRDNEYNSYDATYTTNSDTEEQNNDQPASPGCNQQQYYNVATPGPSNITNSESEVSDGQHQYPTASSTASTQPPSTQEDSQTNAEASSQDNEEPSDDFSGWKVGDRYELMRILGRGSYGEVAQARDLFYGQQDGSVPKHVAIKRIKRVFEQEVDALRLFREIHILRRLRHVCVIELLDIIPPEDDSIEKFSELYLVFEYVDTDLYKLIMSPQYLTTEHIQTFLYQMLTGLKHIHSASVIHRDMKPANILLNEDCSLKICDFGLARIVHSNKNLKGNEPSNATNAKPHALSRQLTKHVVTRWYRAPELILIQPYTTAVDMWSLGCILAELLSMQEGSVPGYGDRNALFPGGSCFPLSGDSVKSSERLDQLSVIMGVIGTPSPEDIESIGNANEYIKSLEKKPAKSLQSMYPAADHNAIDLLQQMLQFNPKKRCTAEQALDHDFLKGVRNKEMEVNAEELIGPDFLDSDKISLDELKRHIFNEVMWFKHRGQDTKI